MTFLFTGPRVDAAITMSKLIVKTYKSRKLVLLTIVLLHSVRSDITATAVAPVLPFCTRKVHKISEELIWLILAKVIQDGWRKVDILPDMLRCTINSGVHWPNVYTRSPKHWPSQYYWQQGTPRYAWLHVDAYALSSTCHRPYPSRRQRLHNRRRALLRGSKL